MTQIHVIAVYRGILKQNLFLAWTKLHALLLWHLLVLILCQERAHLVQGNTYLRHQLLRQQVCHRPILSDWSNIGTEKCVFEYKVCRR